ncbi:MAG: hypothetical protein JXA37_10230 [Chloroflexia bacterium]|nr:hypothetical protein [Chloroflexia bacterium]
MEHRRTYASYLLRMWQVRQVDRLTWRATLQCTATGETRGFPDLESLFCFLREQDQPAAERLLAACDVSNGDASG